MIRDWFNADDAVAVGKTLADYYRTHGGSPASARGQLHPSGITVAGLRSFIQRAARETSSIRLNAFKRARLLNSFKWRLIENGFDRGAADRATEVLLVEVTGQFKLSAADAAALARATSPRSKHIPALIAEADARFAAGKRTEAIASLRQVLRIDADHPAAHAKLGAALCYLGRYPEAEEMLRRAVELDSRCADGHLNLGTLLYHKGELAAAETALRRAVKLDPRSSQALVSLGLTLGALSRLSDAKSCFERTLVVKPRDASALCGLGWLAGVEGRFQDCEKLYRDALEADPAKAHAWAALADMRRMTPADRDWLDSVKRLIKSDVPPLDESALHFAMGKYFDDLGNFAEAFGHYRRANELRKLIVSRYDREAQSARVAETIRACTAERVGQPLEGASQSSKPVFVVGMMRSGTSLVEQIIASHPGAAGAGELDYWSQAAHKNADFLRHGKPDATLAKKLAQSYLETLARCSRDAQRVVDKSTFNSDHLGLIHSVFPQARIIHVRRDPVDTLLSCYFQHFANAASFTVDLSDLAHNYREHHRLMQHWGSVLPRAALLEVPYEELVADQEAWSRRIIDFIGLEWDPRCLEYYKTERPVVTASNWQVRQRIYSSSVGRWRNYRKFIGPLLKLSELKSV